MIQYFSTLNIDFSLHHSHLDYLWLQAQIQWKAHGLSQFGGRKADGTQCLMTDIIPNYNVTLEQVVELNNLCVDYAKPIKLMDPATAIAALTGATSSLGNLTQNINSQAQDSAAAAVSSPKEPKKATAQNHRGGKKGPKGPSTRKTQEFSSIAANPILATNSSMIAAPTSVNNLPQATVTPKTTKPPVAAVDKGLEKIQTWIANTNVPRYGRLDPSKNVNSQIATNLVKRQSQTTSTSNLNDTNVKVFYKPNSKIVTHSSVKRIPARDLDSLCPKPASMRWLKMQGGNLTRLIEIQNSLQASCQNIINELKVGIVPETLPDFDHNERPDIAPMIPAVTVKSKKKARHNKTPVSMPETQANIEFESGTFNLETPLIALLVILAFFTGA